MESENQKRKWFENSKTKKLIRGRKAKILTRHPKCENETQSYQAKRQIQQRADYEIKKRTWNTQARKLINQGSWKCRCSN